MKLAVRGENVGRFNVAYQPPCVCKQGNNLFARLPFVAHSLLSGPSGMVRQAFYPRFSAVGERSIMVMGTSAPGTANDVPAASA